MVSKPRLLLVGESFFAEELTQIQEQFSNVSVGSYPFSRDGIYGATIVLRSSDGTALDSCEKQVLNLINKF